jgi:hypothetical protein
LISWFANEKGRPKVPLFPFYCFADIPDALISAPGSPSPHRLYIRSRCGNLSCPPGKYIRYVTCIPVRGLEHWTHLSPLSGSGPSESPLLAYKELRIPKSSHLPPQPSVPWLRIDAVGVSRDLLGIISLQALDLDTFLLSASPKEYPCQSHGHIWTLWIISCSSPRSRAFSP